MRFSEKGKAAQQGDQKLFGVDFHEFVSREQGSNLYELASEFGLTIRDVKKLKKKLGRS